MAHRPESPIYAISGPTASGKTVLGVQLALRVGGEVVNFDSVQIYKGIELATAKPIPEEMRGVPHHLIDYVEPTVSYTAADWAKDAAAKISEIEARGRVPILVGGTGFYLRTLRQPLFEAPSTDAGMRARLRKVHERHGPGHLYRMLCRVDPKLAAGLPERDYVRVMRGLEFFFQNSEPLSAKQAHRAAPHEFSDRIRLFVLNPPRDKLYAKINERTEQHFAAGLVDEVERLRAAGVRDDSNALGAHAYRRVCEYLRGERTLGSALDRSKQDVRNYAKRQLTWFRREPDVKWLDGFGTSPTVLSHLWEAIGAE